MNNFEHSSKLDIGLSEKDLSRIKEYAIDRFKSNPTIPNRGDNFLAECYVDAIVRFLTENKWSIIDGKLEKNKK